MASGRQVRDALLAILGQPATKKAPDPNSIGPGPTIDTLTPTESVGVAEPRLNQFQEAARETRELDPSIPSTNKKSVFDESPNRPENSPGQLEEITGPPDRVTRGKRTTMDEMDNLFGDEEAKQVEEIKRILSEEGTFTDRDVAGVVATEVVNKKTVDQMAKRVFDKIEDLAKALDTSKVDARVVGPRGQGTNQDVGQSRKLLQNFKKEAAQAASRGRQSGDVTELRALEDRLTAPLQGP